VRIFIEQDPTFVLSQGFVSLADLISNPPFSSAVLCTWFWSRNTNPTPFQCICLILLHILGSRSFISSVNIKIFRLQTGCFEH